MVSLVHVAFCLIETGLKFLLVKIAEASSMTSCTMLETEWQMHPFATGMVQGNNASALQKPCTDRFLTSADACGTEMTSHGSKGA